MVKGIFGYLFLILLMILIFTSHANTQGSEVDRGLFWLGNSQNADGRWGGLNSFRDTATAIDAYNLLKISDQSYLNAVSWLSNTSVESNDYLARRVISLAGSGADLSSDLQKLSLSQNQDGGWGYFQGYVSDVYDTAMVLYGFEAAQLHQSEAAGRAANYLISKQNADGSWNILPDTNGDVVPTSLAVLALIKYGNADNVLISINKGILWLRGKQNPDGGFGDSPSTIPGTALAIRVFLESGQIEVKGLDSAVGYITAKQLLDGSWNQSPYETAAAITSLASLRPNLSVVASDLYVSNKSPRSGEVLTIRAVVRNIGSKPADNIPVQIFAQSPTQGLIQLGTTQVIPTLPVGGSSTIEVTFDTKDGEGPYNIIVKVDPDGTVDEVKKEDNQASVQISVVAVADLVISDNDLVLSKYTARIGEDVTISATISNQGNSFTRDIEIEYYYDALTPQTLIGKSYIHYLDPGETATREVIWKTNKIGTNIPIYAVVDPHNKIIEALKGNNSAVKSINVEAVTEANLTVSYTDIRFAPPIANQGGSVTISALIRNIGFSQADLVEVRFYKGNPETGGILLGAQMIQTPIPGSAQAVSIDWTNIGESGERLIFVKVDPANKIVEYNEDDNVAFATLTILSLPDFAISTNSITFSPAAPKEGDTVAIHVSVQNKGDQGVSNVTLRAFEGSTLIGTSVIPAIPGNSQAVATLTYVTKDKGGPHQITVKVDPDNTVVEQSEDNNQASRTFGVQDANLWLTEPYFSPNGDGIKDSTQFFFRLSTAQTVKIAVVNEKGETVRSFSGSEFGNTTGGTITWDGMNDNGTVVADGEYHIKVIDANNNSVGSLLVVVDNNQSPLTDAIGTKYLLNSNLTCMLPDFWWAWQWFPDESGILFNISEPNQNTPEYPTGLYTMSPDGEDILRIIPWEWTSGVNPDYDISVGTPALSPDGERVAFNLLKRKKVAGVEELDQLWVVDRDGKNLRLLDSYDPSKNWIITYDLKWSPDGKYIVYPIWNNRSSEYDLWLTDVHDTGKTLLEQNYDIGYGGLEHLVWSPDGKGIAYLNRSYDADGCVGKIILSDLSAVKEDIFTMDSCYYYDDPSLEWLSNERMVLIERENVWLIDTSGGGNHVKLSDNGEGEIFIAPDRQSFAFVTYADCMLNLYISDIDGNMQSLHELKNSCNNANPFFSELAWSHDSSKIAFLEGIEPCSGEGCFRTCKGGSKCSERYGPNLILIDSRNNKKTSVAVSNVSEEEYFDYYGSLRWFPDDFFLFNGLSVINSETGERVKIPMDVYTEYVDLSPLGRYITYNQYADSTSVCYSRGYSDLWAISSLLNLTADLRINKEKSAIILKGTAADLNFEGYVLEYADAKTPAAWNLVAPASSVLVIDDVFTTWVPPYEGTFYVRLTVWDKAGNVAWDRRRVSWGLSVSITNLYRSLDYFSPNGDGVKDTVELRYRVLEPVHLEFNVYDDKENLKRTFLKEYSAPVDDYIAWDGRDENGSIVPDGKYKIKVFEYEFFVQLDSIPPDVNLRMSSIHRNTDPFDEKNYEPELHVELSGHAFDKNLKRWLIEYGEGDDPQEWYELKRGIDLLVEKDEQGIPMLNPIKDTIVKKYFSESIVFLAAKKLRITAEDFAGNTSTALTDFLEERIVLHLWDYRDITGSIPTNLVGPGIHTLGGFETVRRPIVSSNLQYWIDGQWIDASPIMPPPSGQINIEWDSSIVHEHIFVRIKGIDTFGQEYFSNMLYAVLFGIDAVCSSKPLVAINLLPDDLRLLKLQVVSCDGVHYPQWTDYKVYDALNGDSIPKDDFYPPLPAVQSGRSYRVRMIGIDFSGQTYISNETRYPDYCPGGGSAELHLGVEYNQAACGGISGKALLSSEVLGLYDVSLETLTYFIEEPAGKRVLRQFDLTQEEWGSVSVDTSHMPEGNYPVEVTLRFHGLNDNTTREISNKDLAEGPPPALVVDRTLPTARITYPGKSARVCPIMISDPVRPWYGIPVEGVAEDNTGVNQYALYYGVGENPSEWNKAYAWERGRPLPISGNKPVTGNIGTWDMGHENAEVFSLKLEVIDATGNVSCYITSFSLDKNVEIAHLSLDKPRFSPNGDGVLDVVNFSYGINEYATVDVTVSRLEQNQDGTYSLGSRIRTIVLDRAHLGGWETSSWDGMDDSNTAVPDGLYGISIFARDPCGNTDLKWTSVEVDNTPPAVAITYPQPSDPLGNIVEVKGTADDPYFQSYILEVGQGDAPPIWSTVSSGTTRVEDDILGKWNTYGLDGRWTLRLTATDAVGNRNATTATVDLGSRETLIKELVANPRLFSPNSDGRIDITTINYELPYASGITIEAIDSGGAIRNTHTNTAASAGVYSYTWDGKDNTENVVPDGIYTMKLTAVLSSNPSVTQEEAVTVVVDSTPPLIAMNQPMDNSFMRGSLTVNGTISDQNILEYSVTYTDGSGSALLDTANQSRMNYTFGIINELPEGNYTLTIRARDLAENSVERNVVFAIDRTPPKVSLDTPKGGEYYGSDKNTIVVSGAIVEKNLDTCSVRYGSGDNPTQWTDLLTGNTVPTNPQLFIWKVGKNDGVPDGLYTLSLFARDKAGATGETKIKVTVDNTLPEVSIVLPWEGEYIRAAAEIRGTASDLNLEKYTLEISEGQCNNAFKWTLLKTATTSVNDGLLAIWQTLPSDGEYCLRLTAIDKIGNKGEARIQVKVDTHPPEAPALTGNVEKRTDVRLNWTSKNEPDLAGYNIYRGNQKINAALISVSTYLDQNLKEGTVTYFAKAVDHAGNESKPSNELKLKVDLTAPDARIRFPQDGSRVSGFVDIKGTAFSSEDFKQYRISIGQGSSPSSWNLIRTSPVPISYGSLVQWDTLGSVEESYSIKLEAEDLAGNINTHQITIAVDNRPPAAPVLIPATPNGSNMTLAWKANSESDLAGYLLYRNDQLPNVSGIVIGDLKPYLIAGTTYLDQGLPDGKFKYYLIAMDSAGNMSDPSNTLEIEIETQSPRATIVEPKNRSKFQNKTMIKAEANDLDIASVQFQYKKTQDSIWMNLGAPVNTSLFITYLDPAVLEKFGDYNLRAIATDAGGQTDTTPPSITVTFTDLASPEPPRELRALTNGRDVTLSWLPNKESDLSGYNIYRTVGATKTKINPSVVAGTTYQDQGLSDDLYTYVATALDTYGNESEPSGSVSARVYAPNIEQPYTPTGQNVIQLNGRNAEAGASVEVFIGGLSSGQMTADSQGDFTFANLLLSLGENSITAKATDSNGNISRISETIVVVYNEPPAAPTGLIPTVEEYTVTLTWNPNAESDLSGYNVYRDSEKLNPPVAVTSGSISASSSYSYSYRPSNALDGNPSTYWISRYGYGLFNPTWWEIDLPSAELIKHIEIHWGSGFDDEGNEMPYAGKDFEIEVWSGYTWITQTKVTGNSSKDTAFDYNPSYRTNRIRIYITDTTDLNYSKHVRISEIAILREDLIPETSFEDGELGDGTYGYRVTAVDYYGFESLPSDEVKATVGDVIPPSAPQDLTATGSGPDMVLTWSPNSEPDLAGYNLYKNTEQGWVRLNTFLLIEMTYREVNLRNGAYTYRLTAVDLAGNESPPSNEASGNIYLEPPEPPTNLRLTALPEGRRLQASWEYMGEPVAGYTLYRSTTSGGPYQKVNSFLISDRSYLDTGLTNGIAYYYVVTAMDALGNESHYSNEAMAVPSDQIPPPKPEIFFPTVPGTPVVLYKNETEIVGNADPASKVGLYKDGAFIGEATSLESDSFRSYSLDKDIYGLSLSPDGKSLAYTSNWSIWLKDLQTGDAALIVQRGWYPIWSPYGGKIAYVFYDENWNDRIGIYDIETGQSAPLTNDGNGNNEYDPSWSSDGRKIAFLIDREVTWDIWIKDLVSGSLTQITGGSDAYYPNLSPDGNKVAYFDDEGLSLIDLLRGETVQIDPGNDMWSLSWSPDSKKLAFSSYKTGNGDIFVVDVENLLETQVTATAQDESNPFWSPDGKSILFTRQEGNTSVCVIPSGGQGGERSIKKDIQTLNYLYWTKSGEIAYADQDQLNIVHPEGHFSFKDVILDSGENLFYVISIDSTGRLSPSSDEISVVFDASRMPDLEITQDDIFIYPPSPIAGEEAMINVVVWNKGAIDVTDVDVDVYLWDATGRLERAKSQRIPYMAAASGEVIPITWNTTGKIGANQVMVVIDPENNIHEFLETNNSATREFFVAEEEGLRMTTILDSSQYGCHQDVKIDIKIQNSGIGRDVGLEIRIEDGAGYPVTLLDMINTQLPYATEKNYSMVWNTGTTFAGSYRVRTVMKNEPTVVAENLAPFEILPEIDIASMAATDKTNYDANENVTVSLSVKNSGHNYAIPELDVKVRIVDSENRDLFAEDRKIKNLLPGSETAMSSIWNAGLQPPGDYHAVVEIYLEGQKISNHSVPFKVDASFVITGHVTVIPQLVFLGDSVEANYTIQNSGNTDVSNLSVRVMVTDPETQTIVNSHEDVISLPMNSAQPGKVFFSTEGYALKTYAINLKYGYQGSEKGIGHTSFAVAVKDGTPPVVTILSPSPNQWFNSAIHVSATATDLASGIGRVEYRLDGGSWKLLPISDLSQGRYSITWSPTASDEGLRTINVRAIDRAGNTSVPVSVQVNIDLTSPNSPDILSPLNHSDLSTEVIDISGVADSGAAVEMVFGSTFRTEADATTGNFSFAGVKLIPGENKFVFRAGDRAGNVSPPAEYTLYLVKPTIEATKSIPDVRNLVVWVNEECKRGHSGHGDHSIHKDHSAHPQCHEDHKKKCVRLDLLGKILDEAADSYLIVNDREDIEKVKAPYYTDILILGGHHFLSEPYRDELRELVYAGKGLISSLYLKREGCDKETDESLFGLEYEGHLSGHEHLIHFVDSSISEEMFLEARGKAVKVEVDDPNRVVAWMEEIDKHQHRHESDKHQCHHKPEKHPGVVLNQHGMGKTVFLAFDLGSTLNDENYDDVSTILRNAITYVHKPLDVGAFHPYQMVPIEVELKSLGSAMDIRVTESYPADIKLYDPMTGKWIIDRSWVKEIHLEPDETKTIYFYALSPDKPGTYLLQTEVGYLDHGVYQFHENLNVEMLVEKDSAAMVDDIIGSLKSLSVSKKDKGKVKDAIESMENIQRRRVATARDIQRNIDDTMEAIDSLLSITGADISEMRFTMGVLLEVYLGKLVLVSS